MPHVFSKALECEILYDALFLNSRNLLSINTSPGSILEENLSSRSSDALCRTYVAHCDFKHSCGEQIHAGSDRVMPVYHLKLTMPVLTKAISNTNVRA